MPFSDIFVRPNRQQVIAIAEAVISLLEQLIHSMQELIAYAESAEGDTVTQLDGTVRPKAEWITESRAVIDACQNKINILRSL